MLKTLIALIISALLVSVPVSGAYNEFDNSRVPDGSVGARYIPAAEKGLKPVSKGIRASMTMTFSAGTLLNTSRFSLETETIR